MADREKVISHLQIISTWAAVDGESGRGIDPQCCRKIVEWIDDALALLKAQDAYHHLQVHNIGNIDIPDGVTKEQFHAVMNNVVDALEHTDKGESWPYDEDYVARCWTSRPTDEQREAEPWETGTMNGEK